METHKLGLNEFTKGTTEVSKGTSVNLSRSDVVTCNSADVSAKNEETTKIISNGAAVASPKPTSSNPQQAVVKKDEPLNGTNEKTEKMEVSNDKPAAQSTPVATTTTAKPKNNKTEKKTPATSTPLAARNGVQKRKPKQQRQSMRNNQFKPQPPPFGQRIPPPWAGPPGMEGPPGPAMMPNPSMPMMPTPPQMNMMMFGPMGPRGLNPMMNMQQEPKKKRNRNRRKNNELSASVLMNY